MPTGSTTVRIATETAERTAALRISEDESTDTVVRKALDALYRSRLAGAAQRESHVQREAREADAAFGERAVDADAPAQR